MDRDLKTGDKLSKEDKGRESGIYENSVNGEQKGKKQRGGDDPKPGHMQLMRQRSDIETQGPDFYLVRTWCSKGRECEFLIMANIRMGDVPLGRLTGTSWSLPGILAHRSGSQLTYPV
ncbi:hypothetical protein ElyMa_001282100 [Elysia marginata]|uniref:Uncharacterized protein n=1 Tax=Elysia marginata TaxID=1093978 RepID=A0AAV4IFG1_9GAST|nr:hypothetical protein ElyMa_001282100 [Elysia marginata]